MIQGLDLPVFLSGYVAAHSPSRKNKDQWVCQLKAVSKEFVNGFCIIIKNEQHKPGGGDARL